MLNISLTIDIPSSYGKQQQDKNASYNDRMLDIEFDILRNPTENWEIKDHG